MDWNAKPKTVTLPPIYPKKQPSFLEQSIINTPSQVPLNPPGSNHPACMFLSNSNPVSQSALNIRNTAPQQISASDMHSRTVFAVSQASVERKTYANVKGPNQLNNSLQMSPGVAQNVWANSPVSNSMFSHMGAAVSQPSSFRTNLPNVNALQNQLVSSEIYSRQGQMVPSNSVRVPITYQGNQRLTSSLSERQADWAQQYTSNGLTYADYRPHPEQYSYPSQTFLQSPALQKQNPMPLTSLQVKNSHPSNSALSLQSKQTAPLPSYQIAVLQTEKRLPTPYDCRYVSQTLQNTEKVITHSSSDVVPQSQEAHISEIRKDFCRGFQQQNLNENVSMIGSFYNVKVNTNINQPFNDPTRSVDGVQILPQNNQDERVDFCNLSSSQVPDTRLAKEKLVKDIKQLVEIKKKFTELARKIKIDKNVLMSSGCIKANSESPQNSELSVKQTGKIQFGPQVTPATRETVEDKSPTAVEIEKTNRMHSTLNSNIQETNCRNSLQVNSILLNPVCSGKWPVPDHLHNLKDNTSFKISAMEQTQLLSGNAVNVEENLQTNSETILVPQSMAFESNASKYLNDNRLLINILKHEDEIEKGLMKDGCETIQDSKPYHSEMNANNQIANNQLNLKTMETPSSCNINTKISENSFCLDHNSSATGVTLNADSHSLELLATCLNLWKKQPSKPTEKQYNELNTHRAAVGISKAGEICDKTPVSLVGNSQNKIENCSQVTALPMVVQNHEFSGATTIKGTELQIAVVSPLISDNKTLPVKGLSPDPLPETVYPVIKEGSVCSLQNQEPENTGVTAVLKVIEPVTSITKTTKIFPLIKKEKQNASINGKSEGAPNTNQGNLIKSEPETHCPVSEQQGSSISSDSDAVSSELLQIDNICSLVEGDTSYNYQIAKIFNPPIENIEPQKLPNLQVISTKIQKDQLDNITEKIEVVLQKDTFLQYTDVLNKISDQSKSPPSPESSFLKHADSNSENIEESKLKHCTKKVNTAKDTCSSAALRQDSNPQEIDVSCNHTAQDPAVSEILDNTSVFFPHNQLSELSKEFPYGIEPVNSHEDSPTQQITDPNSKDGSSDKTSCDFKDATDQIKITILNSEQMKELFPEQNEHCEVDKKTQCEKENPVTKKTLCDSPVHTDGSNIVMDSEKDDVRCCALGWLSNVYEGVPKCPCNSIKNLTSGVENGEDQCSLEMNSCKQGENTSDKDDSIVFKSSPNNPKIALNFPIGKNPFSETEQGMTMKDTSKPKYGFLRTEQELTGPSLSKRVKNLDSLKCHIRKGKVKFHELNIHSSDKRKFSEESSQRKIIGHDSSPPKAKPALCTNKNKDLHIKNGSFAQELLPEENKLETSDCQEKVSAKRKLGEGPVFNSEIKKMKYFKQDQNKNGGVTLKTGTLLSYPDERAKVKTVSDVKSSGSPKDGLPKVVKVITLEQYLQRKKHKEAMGVKASKLNCEKSIPCDSQSMGSSKLMQVESCGKSNEIHSSSVQISEESISICSSHDKKTKIHHSEVAKSYLLGNVKETVGGKQSDKMFIDKTKLDKNLNINNGVEPSHLSPQAKEQRKQYLNRVAFKCIERESICLTKLESLPKNVNKEKIVENKPNSPLLMKNTTEKQSMLEFKLCPDGLINKKTNSTEEQKDLEPCPRKEQATVQVTGIKSSKEDWIKGAPEEKRISEANQEIGVCNSEPLLVRFRRLHSNPRGSLLYAMDGIVLDKAAGTKRGPDELSSACITTGPNSASAANGNDRKKLKGDSKKVKGDSKKVKGDSKKLKGDSKKLKGDSKKLKGDRKKLKGDGKKLKGDGKKLKGDNKKLKGDGKKLKGDNKKLKIDSKKLKIDSKKLKIDSKKLKLKGDGEKLKLKVDSQKSNGDKFKIDSKTLKLKLDCKKLKLESDGSKLNIDSEKLKLKLDCKKLTLKGDGSKLKGDSEKMKGNSKNFKSDNRISGVPSRVICIGKVPGDVTEDEVIFLGLPFGKVTNLLMMKWENQVLIEMNTEEAAITMVNYYTSMTPMLRGQPISIQFSHHKELNTSRSHNQAQVKSALQALNSVQSQNLALASSAGAVGTGTVDAGSVGTMNVAAVDAVNAVDVGPGLVSAVAVSSGSLGSGAVCSDTDDVGPVGAAAVDAGMQITAQSPVLRIIIENLFHPFSLDMLHQIFSHFGKVLKIITFTQNNTFQALLQYAEPLSAELAKVFLDSWNIFGSTVHISFSPSSILNVKYNSSMSRDYTYPALPCCDSPSSQDQAVASAFSAAKIMSAPLKSGAGFPSTFLIPQAAGHCYPSELQSLPPVAITSVSGAAVEAQGQMAILGPAPVAIPSVSGSSAEAEGQIAIAGLAPIAIPSVSGAAAEAEGQIAFPVPAPGTILSVSGPAAVEAGQIAIPGPASAGKCVLLVSNLNPKRIKIQSLFIIFGVYGDVQRVKIFFHDKSRALVQMADGFQAQLAMSYLSGHKLYGMRMLITVTPHKYVHLLRKGQADLGLTKDYRNSPLHRFRNSCPKDWQNVYPPSEYLYLSHIPPFLSVHHLKALFSRQGRVVKNIRFFRKHKGMAVIKMGSVGDAIQALINLHYYDLGENRHLWVTFSKIPLPRKRPF